MSVRLSSLLLLLGAFFAAKSATLTVAAAADLAPTQDALRQAFAQQSPGITVRFVIGASAVLAQQIENGAPYNVFLSADQRWVDDLVKKGKIDGASVRLYATGQVALICRTECSKVQDLTRPDIHFVAIADPKLAPYGAAAKAGLSAVWDQISSKVVYGENVRQALQLFDSGNADAVLTSASLVHGRPGVHLLPAGSYPALRQSGGVVAGGSQQRAAAAFLSFLLSPAGQRVLAQFGFGPGQH